MHDINAIDDRLGRWVGIPGFGVTIPHATGLFGDIAIGDPSWFVGLVWFIGLAGVVWHGNRWLLFRQRERLDWFTNPLAKVFFLVVGCVFFTAPVTAFLLMLWGAWSGVVLGSQVVGTVVLVNVICVLVVTHMYETAFLIGCGSVDVS